MSQGSLYFEDFPAGFAYETGTRTLSLEEIAAFAREWDPRPSAISNGRCRCGQEIRFGCG